MKPHQPTTSLTAYANKDIKISSENFQKKEVGSDRSVSKNLFSSVIMNDLAVKTIESIDIVISSFNKVVHPKTDINP